MIDCAMTHSVTLPDHTTFSIHNHETILAAAARQDLHLPHSCQNGFCGQCKAELISGEISMGDHSGKALSLEEAAQGKILMCCTTAHSNLAINIPGYAIHQGIPIITLPARVHKLTFKHDVAILKLALPKAPLFSFYAGQHIELLLPGHINRCYSLANAPDDGSGMIELHIRKREHGLCSNMIFSDTPKVKEKSIVRIKGPSGAFALHAERKRPLIFLATGTGYAPVRSMLMALLQVDYPYDVHVYWGARHAVDLYSLEEAQALTGRLKNGRFTPVLSRPDAEWQGESGYIQAIAAQDYPDMRGHDVYACGSEAMVSAAQTLLTNQCNLPAEAFYADAFLAAA